MGKADEAAAKRKNKAARKRLRSSGGAAHHTGVNASRRRKKAGKRRICEGMCYSLPTPDDPFNDRSLGRGKKSRYKSENERPGHHAVDSIEDDSDNEDEVVRLKDDTVGGAQNDDDDENEEEDDAVPSDGSTDEDCQQDTCSDDEDSRENEFAAATPYNRSLLLRIANSSNGAGIALGLIADAERPCSQFDKSFWDACREGLDVIASVENAIAPAMSYVPAAVSFIVRQPSRARYCRKPIALFLVSSQHEALYVRSLCKPLKKVLGIQAISIHPGTSLEHQVEGLKSSGYQILISTPERLCELLSRKAVSLLSVSFLVVDCLDVLIQNGFMANLHTIRQHANHAMQTVILSKKFSEAEIELTRSYVEDPVARVVDVHSLKNQAACITQDVRIVVDDAKRMSKVVAILNQLRGGDDSRQRTLIVTRNPEDAILLASALKREGHRNTVAFENDQNLRSSELLVLTQDELESIDLSGVQNVINYECLASIDRYCRQLTSIARSSAHGRVFTLCGFASAPVARDLVRVLEQCSQLVPSALQMLAKAAEVVIKHRS